MDSFNFIRAFIEVMAVHRQESIDAYKRAVETKHQRYEDEYRGRLAAINVAIGVVQTAFRPDMTIEEFIVFCRDFQEDSTELSNSNNDSTK